jgi:hypothetical protein
MRRAFVDGFRAPEFNPFVFEHMTVLMDFFVSDPFAQGIVFHEDDKMGTSLATEGIVGTAPVRDDDGSGTKMRS